MSGYIGVSTYRYTHIGALAFGFWAIVDQKSLDAVIMVRFLYLKSNLYFYFNVM